MANKQLKARVKNKRDTATNWTSKNPVILNGEIILVDTNEGELRAKVGDGTKTYSQLPFSDAALRTLIENKVDKVNGKGLSTNDYTAEDKLKLLGIDAGANKTVVDSALSSTSVNPVQNKVVNASISNLAGLIGDTSVASQISKAIDDVKKGTVSSATHATSADKATTADSATSADTATRATTADSATSATKATQDGNGKVISSTYETKTDAEAKLTEAKKHTDTVAAGKANTSHTHAIADVTNLQTTLDAKASASSVTALQGLVGDTKVATQISTAVGAITPASIGASASGHTHSSYVNQNAFSNVTVGSTTIAADSVTDTLTLAAGSNITLTPDATNDKVTIAATNTTYSVVSTTADGLAPKRDGSTTKFLRADGTWAVPPDTDTTYTLGSFGLTATAAELNYCDGVTSSIQTQLNGKAAASDVTSLRGLVGDTAVATQISNAVASKQNTITGAATTITGSNLTASRALVSDGSGKVAVSDVTSTELGYLDGVTDNIQTQFNSLSDTYMTKVAPSGSGVLTMDGDGVFSGEVEVQTLNIAGVTMNYDTTNGFLEIVFPTSEQD